VRAGCAVMGAGRGWGGVLGWKAHRVDGGRVGSQVAHVSPGCTTMGGAQGVGV